MKRNVRSTSIAGAFIAALVLPATALAAEHDGQWRVGAEIYLWGADTEISTAAGQEVDASFNDVIDNLEMAFMGALVARKDSWSWFGDVMYVGIDGSNTVPATIPGVPDPIDASVRLEQDAWIVTAGGGYELSSTSDSNVDFVAGIRYFDLSTDVTVDLGGGMAGSVRDSSDVLDGVVGIKGRTGLAHKWTLGYYADVGTGQSDLTYQALIDFNYAYSKVALGFGYRFLKWDFDGKGYLDDFQISGPFVGLIFRFK